MMPSILDAMRRMRLSHCIPSFRCLEVGSFDVNGSPRVVFPDATNYHGIDIMSGPGVDQVGDAEDLLGRMCPASWDTVICCETLEHTIHPWTIVQQMKRVLAPGGFLWISTPTYGFPLHRFPIDTYRFGEDAYRLWLYEAMGLLALETVRDAVGFPAIVAVGQKWSAGGNSHAGSVWADMAGRND